MTASYLIGLREGLEATLVVSILVAFLVKTNRSGRLPLVWAGVAAAVALSVGFGALLTYTSAVLSSEHKELFEAVASIVAVFFVTWMIFWMRRVARRLAGELRTRLEDAVRLGPVAVVAVAFLAVAREGLETALLYFAAMQGSTSSAGPLLAITGGIVTAMIIGWLLYASVMRINLGRFFTWTGVLLVLVAAGILKYGVHDLQESGVLPGLSTTAFDISGVLHPDAWYTALLTGMFNITPQPSVLETVAWIGYALPVLAIFLWRRPGATGPKRRPDRESPEVVPATAPPSPAASPAVSTPASPVVTDHGQGPRRAAHQSTPASPAVTASSASAAPASPAGAEEMPRTNTVD